MAVAVPPGKKKSPSQARDKTSPQRQDEKSKKKKRVPLESVGKKEIGRKGRITMGQDARGY